MSERYKYDFQNQERQTDLNLNWDSFKYRNYDYAIGRFMSVDPLAEKYPYNATYAFSENRVIDGVELEGLEVRLIVDPGNYSKGNVGHTFVAIGNGEKTVVYTYGRYGELDKEKGSLNGTNFGGEGVLIKLEGKDALHFIDHYVNENNASVYELENIDETMVKDVFEKEFNSSNQIPTTGKYANDKRARVVDRYDLFNNNCTTKSLHAIEEANGRRLSYKAEINNPKFHGIITAHIVSITPEGLKQQLDEATEDPNSGIKNVTNDFKKKEEQ